MDVAVRVVIQARMGSTRLPGKIMAPLAGRPLLEHVVRRMQASGRAFGVPWEVMVATTDRTEDDLTKQLCRHLDVPCFRGDALDVLARYVAATADLDEQAIAVRATADNPLYCPHRTAAMVHELIANEVDYASIRELSPTVPEVFRVGALRSMARVAVDPYQREHVTPFFRQFPWSYRVRLLPLDWQGLRRDVPLTIDTPVDLARLRSIFAALGDNDAMFAVDDAYRRWDAQRPVREELAAA
jgi:spore coat polysaccharide biosynthesis protein SpsF